ncbi:unnamed protein product [Boreogadus saida]
MIIYLQMPPTKSHDPLTVGAENRGEGSENEPEQEEGKGKSDEEMRTVCSRHRVAHRGSGELSLYSLRVELKLKANG